jgi:hypothetical protein
VICSTIKHYVMFFVNEIRPSLVFVAFWLGLGGDMQCHASASEDSFGILSVYLDLAWLIKNIPKGKLILLWRLTLFTIH